MQNNKLFIDAIENITFSNDTKTFFNISNLEKILIDSGFKIISSYQDLLYFNDEDKRFQDYDGMEYFLIIENKDYRTYTIKFRHLNTKSVLCEKTIYREGNVEFEDYSMEREIYNYSIDEFLEENNLIK